MGGAVALEYAYRYRVDSLVLIDSMGLQVEASYVDKLGYDKAKELYLDICSTENMKTIMDLEYVNPPYILDIVLEYLTEIKCKELNIDVYRYSFLIDKRLYIKESLIHQAKSIKVPTLAI